MTTCFKIGLIADVQYADIDDGHVEGRHQRYREAPEKLENALNYFSKQSLAAVLHLGDIINGNTTHEQSLKEFEKIYSIFDKSGLSSKTYHVLGNHCLSVGRSTLLERLCIPRAEGYYDISLPNNWRLLVLDTTEISGHSGYPEDSWQYKEAREFERLHPLSTEHPHMSPWNGGISQKQLKWLEERLATAHSNNERVIVASHHQFGASPAARATHLAYNHFEIREACLSSPAFRIALAGHDHVGGYLSDGEKQHFVTLEAVLEATDNAYAVMNIYDDRVVIEGFGSCTSRVLSV